MTKNICAVIITYNIDNKIRDVVNSIQDQVDKIVIVDNGSSKETINILKSINGSNIELILNKHNIGIAKAINYGVKYAQRCNYKWVLTLDHDSICEENYIKNMFNTYNQVTDKKNIGILAPKVFEINKQEYISCTKDLDKPYVKVKDCIQSGAIFNIECFEKVGYFNEDLFVYHVDYDYCERILKNDYTIIQCNNCILNHEEGYKVPKKFFGKKLYYNNYSAAAIYYITRNTIYMSKVYSIKYLKRIIKDFVFIIMYDQNRYEIIKYWYKGLKDGINNKYGCLNE